MVSVKLEQALRELYDAYDAALRSRLSRESEVAVRPGKSVTEFTRTIDTPPQGTTEFPSESVIKKAANLPVATAPSPGTNEAAHGTDFSQPTSTTFFRRILGFFRR
jgi:hypothetical protein